MTNRHYHSDILAAIKDTFVSVESAIESASEKTGCQKLARISGTTATVALRVGQKLYLAHVGDSRAMYCTFSASLGMSSNTTIHSEGSNEEEADYASIETTEDHNPNRADEKARIERCGGEVRQVTENLPFRLYKKDKHKPGLAMSRALGDIDAQQCGLLYEPEIKVFDLTKAEFDSNAHHYVVVASDGVWEMLENEEIVKEIRMNCTCSENIIAEKIAQKAATNWLASEKAVSDDITVIVHRIK